MPKGTRPTPYLDAKAILARQLLRLPPGAANPPRTTLADALFGGLFNRERPPPAEPGMAKEKFD